MSYENRLRADVPEAFIIDTFTRVDKDGKEHPVNKPEQVSSAPTL